jgi:hypothetical protein
MVPYQQYMKRFRSDDNMISTMNSLKNNNVTQDMDNGSDVSASKTSESHTSSALDGDITNTVQQSDTVHQSDTVQQSDTDTKLDDTSRVNHMSGDVATEKINTGEIAIEKINTLPDDPVNGVQTPSEDTSSPTDLDNTIEGVRSDVSDKSANSPPVIKKEKKSVKSKSKDKIAKYGDTKKFWIRS